MGVAKSWTQLSDFHFHFLCLCKNSLVCVDAEEMNIHAVREVLQTSSRVYDEGPQHVVSCCCEDLLSEPDDGLGCHGLKGLRTGSVTFNLFPSFFGITEGLSAELTV